MKLSDMLFANAMMGEGGGGGGGGGGDFSTATVTIHTNLNDAYFMLYGAVADISYGVGYTEKSLMAITALDADAIDGKSYEVVLYRGFTYLTVSDWQPTVSGNASVIPYDYGYIVEITGDCTVSLMI